MNKKAEQRGTFVSKYAVQKMQKNAAFLQFFDTFFVEQKKENLQILDHAKIAHDGNCTPPPLLRPLQGVGDTLAWAIPCVKVRGECCWARRTTWMSSHSQGQVLLSSHFLESRVRRSSASFVELSFAERLRINIWNSRIEGNVKMGRLLHAKGWNGVA